MFRKGDIVVRKPECQNEWLWLDFVRERGLPKDAQVIVTNYVGTEESVINYVYFGNNFGWSPKKFELVNITKMEDYF